jgi:hypothetical protein
LRHLLAAAVILPAAGVLGAGLYSAHGWDDWSTTTNDAPGFALCGLFGVVPVAVGVIWLAARAFVRRDAGLHGTIAAGCGLGAFLLTLSLGEAAAVAFGLREGRVPVAVLLGVGGTWLYFITVGLGHWYLWRVFRPPARPTDQTPG